MRCISLLLLLFVADVAVAQAPPGTDIWLVDLAPRAMPGANEPLNLTARPGYDNQPAFVTSHSFLFTSMDAGGQTDAWHYDLDGNAAPLLTTPESEYSATPAPDGAVSVVRVALDGTQQLWLLQPGADNYELLFPLLEGIGYHAWIDDDRVALFMLRDSMELHIANRRDGKVAILAKDIGRSLQMVPGMPGNLGFIEPGVDGKPWIKRLDIDAAKITPLAPVMEGSEDFLFLPDGRILMARERTVYFHDERWQVFARFPQLPGEITRLALSPDAGRLLMVVAESE